MKSIKKNLNYFSFILLSSFLFIGQSNFSNEFFRKKHGEPGFDNPGEFAKYHFEIRTKAGEQVPTYPTNYQFQELTQAKLNTKKSGIQNIEFKSRGPYNVPGRTRTIVVDPDDETNNTIYAGSVSGGLWKTTDGGQTWNSITENLPNLSVSCLVIAPSNHNVMYMGTGEAAFGAYTPAGGGIFHSIDKGENWYLLSKSFHDSIRSVSRIVVDPFDENTLLASVCSHHILFMYQDGSPSTSQILKSINGGRTWYSVFDAELDYRDGIVQQIIADPNDFNVLYATQYNTGFLKSTNKGESWQFIRNGLPTSFGRIELDISRQNTNLIYASVQDFSNLANNSALYVSRNAGESWTKVVDNSINQADWLLAQGNYDNVIMVHPFYESIVYLGGIDLWRAEIEGIDGTTDLSMNIIDVTDRYQRRNGKNANVHVDHHVLTPIIRDNEFCILNGNDGGIYISDFSEDAGIEDNSWTTIGNGYNTSQFYGVEKKKGVDIYIGGTQDNGTWMNIDSNNVNEFSAYDYVIGGDGFDAVFHYNKPNTIIGSAQRNYIVRTDDNFQTMYFATEGLFGNHPFMTRLANSKSDPDLLFTYSDEGIFKSENFGLNWHLCDVNKSMWLGTRGDFDISLCNNQIVWFAEGMNEYSSPYLSIDGGITWNTVKNYKNIGYITGLAAHPTQESTAYMLFAVNSEPKILVTNDYGNTWSDISGFDENSQSSGFPNVAVYSLLVMPFNTDILWAGTEIGIFESTDNGLNWHLITEFPAVDVIKMKIVDDQVLIATYGRGIWTAEMPDLDLQMPIEFTKPPIITGLSQNYFSNEYNVNLSFEVRDVYDFLYLVIDNQEVVDLAFKNTIGEKNLKLFIDESEFEIQLYGIKDLYEYKSVKRALNLVDMNEAVFSFEEDFNVPYNSDVMIGDLFNARYYPGFYGDQSIHTEHDYEINTNESMMIKYPFIIASSDAKITYKDVAIVEPGFEGSVYGDPDFYDYVIVEATNNGIEWIPIEGGYDARYNEDWLFAYENNIRGSSDMFVEHEINLLDFFNLNDTIAVRFRLYSDNITTGYGWVVDDLKFMNTSMQTSIIDYDENYRIFPNPVHDFLFIESNNSVNENARIMITDISGKIYIEEELHDVLDISSLSSGIYFISIEENYKKYTKKIMVY